MSKKFYVVKNGYKCGIFETWDECKKQVDGYSGAVYKSFKNYDDAKNFLNENFSSSFENAKNFLVAYVDGSYNVVTKEFSYGMVIIFGDEEKYFSEKFSDEPLSEMRNVAGEIMGSTRAFQYALENGFENILIHYDYEGIEKWCTGEWKANKQGTKNYKMFYDSIKNKLNVVFKKVKAHSGNKYNDLADSLAKKVLGL